MTRLPTFMLAIGLSFACPLEAAAGQITTTANASQRPAQQLARRLAEEPARDVVQSYGDHFEGAVLSHLERGETDWIALAPKLAAGTDAGTSEGLSIALAYALPLQPVAVLAVLSKRSGPLGVERVCSIPFIEDSVKDIKSYQRRAIRAVSEVRDTGLQQARERCLQVLRY
ncbi:hypothetical protein [Frateuria aurantia]|uniref:Uncharacterized protein n=1 Tax=Frateuria aurantia (strain ATCC 33424 / DSM 6220 / KCTC 2777 / LMG 1558 / NBRC 3245 / NCIMB 13370) TaxID=767434 RepID=H8L5F4_FRAAD|nr:hypothetical protein [Frateuria aurantia]AFC85755.1 hypothetical protein Fraau_1316 [Frateuria aurantia DSM 6220]